ncbi:hypothetical protein AX17_001986 [Amanita inopinata Kibby_2008]|nr:hypothetical protein AX17_001986 [Amanita inopinata Kibby_2008]
MDFDMKGIISPSTTSLDSDADDESLRTFFDDATKGCNTFRILLIGKSGSGKSTLVNEVFEFEDEEGSASDFVVGEHDINNEIISSNNKSLILHDSKGLESGSDLNLKTISRFIEERKGKSFPEQLHAIWYCVEVPVGGERVFEGGDLRLFQMLKQSNSSIAMIVVFTKIDRLRFQEKRRLKKGYVQKGMDSRAATERAQSEHLASAEARYNESCVGVLQSVSALKDWAKYCAVSNKLSDTIINLIRLTKTTLSESESLSILWARVQMADVDLKVTQSLDAAKNVFWRGVASRIIPLKAIRNVSVLKVLSRIHMDIVRIWNIKDPEEILVGANMRTMIRNLFVEPNLTPALNGAPSPSDNDAAQILSVIAGAAVNPMQAIGPAVLGAAKMLDDMIDTTPGGARLLMAYTIDLTLGLENLYWLVHPRKNKSINDNDLIRAFTRYRASKQRERAHRRIRDFIGDDNVC